MEIVRTERCGRCVHYERKTSHFGRCHHWSGRVTKRALIRSAWDVRCCSYSDEEDETYFAQECGAKTVKS